MAPVKPKLLAESGSQPPAKNWWLIALTLLVALHAPAQDLESVKRLTVGALKTNCYILRDIERRETLVIDPGDEADRVLSEATTHDLQLQAVLLTHAHQDHLAACAAIQKATGAPVWIDAHDLPAARELCPGVKFITIQEAGALDVGGFSLTALKTPGHTPGSVCFLWGDRLFSGDTLFFQNHGNTDRIEVIRRSIQEQLWPLGDKTKVYPGHGPLTSIGFERQSNPISAGAPPVRQPKRSSLPADDRTPQKILIVPLEQTTEFIEQWYICGPFATQGAPDLVQRWAAGPLTSIPQADHFFAERYQTKQGAQGWAARSLETQSMASTDPQTGTIRALPTRIINFQAAYPEKVIDSSAYALALIDTPTSQTRPLLLGSDDGIAVWLNGQPLHKMQKERPIVPDEDFAIARFRPGLNVLLVQVTNVKGYWGFMLRLPAARNQAASMPLPDMKDID